MSETVMLDAGSHSADAIQRAAYRLSGVLTVELTRDGANWNCEIFPVNEDATGDLATLFRRNVIDEVLRERIRVETEANRNLILSVAFSETGLIEPS